MIQFTCRPVPLSRSCKLRVSCYNWIRWKTETSKFYQEIFEPGCDVATHSYGSNEEFSPALSCQSGNWRRAKKQNRKQTKVVQIRTLIPLRIGYNQLKTPTKATCSKVRCHERLTVFAYSFLANGMLHVLEFFAVSISFPRLLDNFRKTFCSAASIHSRRHDSPLEPKSSFDCSCGGLAVYDPRRGEGEPGNSKISSSVCGRIFRSHLRGRTRVALTIKTSDRQHQERFEMEFYLEMASLKSNTYRGKTE